MRILGCIFNVWPYVFILLSIHHVTLCLLCCLFTMWRYVFILLSTPHVKWGRGGSFLFSLTSSFWHTVVGNLLSETDIDTCLKRKRKKASLFQPRTELLLLLPLWSWRQQLSWRLAPSRHGDFVTQITHHVTLTCRSHRNGNINTWHKRACHSGRDNIA